MNSQSFSMFSFLLITIQFLILLQSHIGSSYPGEFYSTCGNTFSCGNTITQIGYPFRGSNDPRYCGHPSLVLNCNDEKNVTTIDILNTKYRVLEIYPATQTMRIVRDDIVEETCPKEMVNTTLDHSLFDFAAAYTNFTFLYGCPSALRIPGLSLVPCGNDEYDNVYLLPGNQGPGKCEASVTVPVLLAGNGSVNGSGLSMGQVLQQGFDVRWKIGSEACSNCAESNGRCGFNYETNRTTCFCPDPPFVAETCPMATEASPKKPPPRSSSTAGMCNASIIPMKWMSK